jgi:putative tryptophan/tyrosine transport system substrate-binding protein
MVGGIVELPIDHSARFPSFPPGEIERRQIAAAAESMNVQVHAVGVRGLAGLEGSLPDILKESLEALFVGSAGWFEDHPWQIVDFALKSRLPALYIRRDYVEIGGAMSYGIDYREMYRTSADYVARVLRGTNAGNPSRTQAAQVDPPENGPQRILGRTT